MIPANHDPDRPVGRPTIPDRIVDSVARRSNLDTGQTRDMLTDFFGALDTLDAQEVSDLTADVDAPVPFTITPGALS